MPYKEKRETNAVSKIYLTQENKNNYVINWATLQEFLRIDNRLKITKIHKILSYDARPWIKSYIEFNTLLRSKSKNDAEKNIWKLYNNSIFGKTIENVEKRVNVEILNDPKKTQKLINKGKLSSINYLSENFIIAEKFKKKLLINKPSIVGTTILDLSKQHMYQSFYEIKKQLNGVKLLYMDTDSLILSVETLNIYKDILTNEKLMTLFDFSKNENYKDLRNKDILGKFKDELKGKNISEFIALKPKMYSFITDTNEEKKVGKGIKKNKL